MKKQILHICNMTMNGKAAMLVNVLEKTDYSQYEITLLNFGGNINKSLKPRLDALPVTVISEPLRYKGVKRHTSLSRELKKYLEEHKVDVIHTHIGDFSGSIVKTASKYGVPVRVVHSHNTGRATKRGNPVLVWFREKVIGKFFIRDINKYANRFYACSEAASHWLFDEKKIKDGDVIIIPNGSDLKKFEPAQYNADVYREKYNIPQTKYTVLFVGGLRYQKNPVFMLKIFEQMAKIEDDVHLILVGSGDLKDEVDTFIAEHNLTDKCTLIPNTPDIPALLSLSDLLLLPSRFEGLPVILIEAQAAGVPCLTSSNVSPYCQCGLVTFLDPEKDDLSAWGDTGVKLMTKQMPMTRDEEKLHAFSIEKTVETIFEHY